MRKLLARLVVAAVLCVAYTAQAHAQAVYGSLVGNVTDSSGATSP